MLRSLQQTNLLLSVNPQSLRDYRETVYNHLIHSLIRDGIDQCQNALRKLSSRKLYREQKDSLPAHLKDRKLDTRSFRLDNLVQKAEELIARLRTLRPQAKDDEPTGGGVDSDGWADPDDESSSGLRPVVDSDNNSVEPPSSLSPLDPHVHANTKGRPSDRRRRAASKRSHRGDNGQSRSKKHRSRHPYSRRSHRRRGKENDETEKCPLDESSSVGSQNEHAISQDSAPRLEELLDSRTRETDAGKSASAPKRQRSEPDIATRMERFLSANTELTRDFDTPSSGKKVRQPRPRRRRGTSERVRTKREQRWQGSQSSKSSRRVENVDELHEQLVAELAAAPTPTTDNEIVSEVSLSLSVEEICLDISKTFPKSASRRFVNGATRIVLAPGGNKYAPLLLKTLLRALESQGYPILQQIVANEPSVLNSYVALYVAVLDVVRKGLNAELKEGDGITFSLFSPERFTHFLDFLILQLVDSVYSIVHPAWALKAGDLQKMCRILEPLRDALAGHVALTECVCKCVLRNLNSQTWRSDHSRRALYVSSVDPKAWNHFLTASRRLEHAKETRFAKLGKFLPTCEVRATWSLLAYFACAAQQRWHCSGSDRWILASQLLVRGALSDSSSSVKPLPPSNDQLRGAVTGVEHLGFLVLSNGIGPIPPKDTLLVDILKRALRLQADDITFSEESREAMFPAVADERKQRKLVMALWDSVKKHGENVEMVQMPLSRLAKELLSRSAVEYWMSQPSLFPSSDLLRCCIGLILAWAGKIYVHKPARGRRFELAMRALVKCLVEDSQSAACETSRGPVEKSSSLDPFQTAFSEKIKPPNAGLPDPRRQLFLHESAAYLKLFTEVGSKSLANDAFDAKLSLCEDVWHTISDKTMQSRVTATAPLRSYEGDVLRPYVAAKVLTLLSLLCLGVSPLGDTPAQAAGSLAVFEDGRRKTLVYLMGCLVACLECSSVAESPEVAGSVSRLLTLLVQHSRRAFENEVEEQDRRKEIVLKIIGIVDRNFRRVTSAAFCGSDEDVCLMTTFSLLRSVLLFDWWPCTQGGNKTNGRSHPDSNEDDVWGGLSDSVLQEVDIGEVTVEVSRKQQNQMGESLHVLFRTVFAALQHALPSQRYEVVHRFDPANTIEALSPQGKILVGRRSEMASFLLASIIAHPSITYQRSKDLFREVTEHSFRPEVMDQFDDMEFHKRTCEAFSAHFCCLAKSSTKAAQIVRENHVMVLFVLIDSLLEIKWLMRIPSCNIRSISARSGGSSEDRAIADYVRYTETMSSATASATAKTEFTWKFAADFGRTLKQSEEGGADRLFEMADHLLWKDMDVEPTVSVALVASLERECLDRLRCIRGLIELSPSFPDVRFPAFLIASSSVQLLKLTKLLNVEEKSAQDDKTSYKLAALYELFSCYVELHTGLLAWTFRHMAYGMTDGLSFLWTEVCDCYVSPILQANQSLATCLENAGRVAMAAFSGLKAPVVNDTTGDEVGVCDKAVQECLIRRSRELILPLAAAASRTSTGLNMSFLKTIIAVGARGTLSAKLIGRSFFPTAYVHHVPASNSASSPLQFELEKYIACVDEQYPLTSDIRSSLNTLKRTTLEVLASYLTKQTSTREKNKAALMLLRQICELERSEATNPNGRPRIELQTFYDIARGMGMVVKGALASLSADDELLSLVFSFATCVARLPAACFDSKQVGWMSDWCVALARTDPVSGEVDSAQLLARYLQSFFAWLRKLAATVSDSTEAAVESLHSCRCSLFAHRCDTQNSWPPRLDGIVSPDHTSHLKKLDEILRRHTGGRIVTNVYAISRPTERESREIQKWRPNDQARRAATEFSHSVPITHFDP